MRRYARTTTLAFVHLVGLLGGAASARADEPTRLAALEDAAASLDFVAVRDEAETALASGELGPAELVRLHQLVAMARSFDGNPIGARSSYETMLALDPSARPDPSVPPRLFSPFEEARGHASAVRVAAETSTDGDVVSVRVVDGIGAITEATLVYRDDDAEPIELAHPSGPVVRFEVPAAIGHTVAYWVTLRDRFGNRWVELGSVDAPVTFVVAARPVVVAPATRRRLVRSPWLWTAVGISVTGLALGLGFGLGRERDVRAVTSVSF